jgi:hypothetical protein
MPKIADNKNVQVLKATMRASRAVSNVEPDYMHFEIVDDLSRCIVCQVKMSLLDYANMLTLHEAKAEITVWKDAPIGKRCEYKTEVIPFLYRYGKEAEAQERAIETLKSFEIDGWKGDVSDLFHQRRDGGWASVRFTRYADVEEEKK